MHHKKIGFYLGAPLPAGILGKSGTPVFDATNRRFLRFATANDLQIWNAANQESMVTGIASS